MREIHVPSEIQTPLFSEHGDKWTNKKELEKELLSIVRKHQDGAARISYKSSHRPPWWKETQVIKIHWYDKSDQLVGPDDAIEIPLFDSQARKNWSLEQMRALIILSMIDSAEPSMDPGDDELKGKSKVKDMAGMPASQSTALMVQTYKTTQNVPVHNEIFASHMPTSPAVDPTPTDQQAMELKREERRQRIESIIEELLVEVDARSSELRALAQNAAFSLKNSFRVQLMKLPRKVRTMKISQFCTQFQGDIDTVLLKDIEKNMFAAVAAASARKKSISAMKRNPLQPRNPNLVSSVKPSLASNARPIKMITKPSGMALASAKREQLDQQRRMDSTKTSQTNSYASSKNASFHTGYSGYHETSKPVGVMMMPSNLNPVTQQHAVPKSMYSTQNSKNTYISGMPAEVPPAIYNDPVAAFRGPESSLMVHANPATRQISHVPLTPAPASASASASVPAPTNGNPDFRAMQLAKLAELQRQVADMMSALV